MKPRLPLYSKILLWFFLNLLVLGVVFFVFFQWQFGLGFDWFLNRQIGTRAQALAELASGELAGTPRERWDDVLARYSTAYQSSVGLFRVDGRQIAGKPMVPPQQVLQRIGERPGFGPGMRGGMGQGPGQGRGPRHAMESGPPGPLPAAVPGVSLPWFLERSDKAPRWWVGIRIPLMDEGAPGPGRLVLLMASDSLVGGGMFVDYWPLVLVGIGVVVFSALFWLPLVRGLTRSIKQMTRATEAISEGRFDSRVDVKSRDELGRLGAAINRMAGRLEGFVSGQKRFLGDISHELCSPIARIQMALGILEERAGDAQKQHVSDLREDVQLMSTLVNELLSFSKAGLGGCEIRLQPVEVAEIIRRVVEREAQGEPRVVVESAGSVRALAEGELLSRALANLVRNALRYSSGAVRISATASDARVRITVADEGPGVPEDALQKIFDPFFRLDSSRSRETGGFGLGLAIVKTCVEAGGGTVRASNRQPSGLEVLIELPAAGEGQQPGA
jgi:two-component system sensor histidine kinase CpxA